jgi:phage shock protein A
MSRGILMGVLERIESIIRANLNDLLERPGDPERAFGRLISDMESELADARVQMATAIREEKRLKKLCIENEQSAEEWHRKAILAVQRGRDDLAKEALLRKRAASTLAEDYMQESDLHAEVVISLKSALKALEAKIQEAKREKNELTMRKRQLEMNRLLGQNGIANGQSVLKRM